MRCWYFSLTLGGVKGFRKRLKERKNQPWIGDQCHHRLVVDDDLAAAGALNHLAGALIHNLGGEVLGPALGAEQVAALQPRHQLPGQNRKWIYETGN